jgi:hypothetical protein
LLHWIASWSLSSGAHSRDPLARNDGEGADAACELGDHQHVEHDDRRQAQDRRPDAERPKNVLGRKALLFREWIILRIHDAPRFLFLRRYRYAPNFKKPVAVSLAFDHGCYRGLTTGARLKARKQAGTAH